ncbi:MAG: 30S ribosomal protein S6, partial [Dehalococcoidia bacterium]
HSSYPTYRWIGMAVGVRRGSHLHMSRISGGNVNEYELMTVFHPRLNADDTATAVANLEAQVTASGGELLSTDDWGRRRLAYPIDGVLDGTYVLMTFKMPPTATADFERWIRLSETTLRHLLIRGIIPFEGDRYGRDDRRDDGDRQDDWDGPSDRDGADRDDTDRDETDRDEVARDEAGPADQPRDDAGDDRPDDEAPSDAPAAAADADAESED